MLLPTIDESMTGDALLNPENQRRDTTTQILEDKREHVGDVGCLKPEEIYQMTVRMSRDARRMGC